MKKKMPCYVAGIMILGLVLLVVSCGGTTTPVTPTSPTAPTTPATPTTPTPEPATPTGEIPAIPHTLEGRDDCLVCHGEGAFKPFPADHAGRTSDTCTTCHQSAG